MDWNPVPKGRDFQVKTFIMKITVNGYNWDKDAVLATDKTEAAFVKRHMEDVNTYKDVPKEKKEADLRLVWKQCNA